MAFFLIVPSVIIVTIFLVHSIAERLGFKVKYFSLILCAVMSLAVNIAAIQLSTYLDKWHYIRLGALILIASIIVTLINRYLLKHDKTDVKIITNIEEELAIEEAAAAVETSKSISGSKSDEILKIDKPINSIDDKANESEKVDKPVLIKKSESVTNKPPTKSQTKDIEQADNKSPLETIKVEKPNEVKQVIKPVNGKKSEGVTTGHSEIKPTVKKSTADKKAENKAESKTVDKPINAKKSESVTAKPIETKKIDKQAAELSKTDKPAKTKKSEAVTNVKPPQSSIEDKIADINAHLGSLDDILDYAYAKKSKGDLNQAILAYQKALDRYKNDDYAPFIAIDLGNIYKELAAYSKVIKIYEEALKLPVVMRNADTRKEFTKNLAYLRIVQSVLLRHRALTMPFSKIPSQYLKEIENEFKSAQLNNSSRRNF